MKVWVGSSLLAMTTIVFVFFFQNCGPNSGFQIKGLNSASLSGANSFSNSPTNVTSNSTSNYPSNSTVTKIDGAALYTTNCSSCHGALASSTKIGRTSAQISAAILAQASMMSLKILTAAEVDAIAAALAAPHPAPSSSPLFSCVDPTTRGLSDTGMRRLTYREFVNTLNDLLGPAVVAQIPSLQLFPPDAILQSVSEFTPLHSSVHVQAILNISLEAGQALVANLTALTAAGAPSCLTSAISSNTDVTTTCLTSFINTFGRRVFRRPVNSTTALPGLGVTQLQNILNAYSTNGITGLNTADKVALVAARILESPQFHFLMEYPTGTVSGSRVQVDSYTVAARLSYALTGSTPDSALLDAAGNGGLNTLAGVKTQAQRLLASAGGHREFRDIVTFWLRMGTLGQPNLAAMTHFGIANDNATSVRLQSEAINETLDFAEYIAFIKNGTFQDLMNSNLGFPKSAEMAKILGVSTYNVSSGVPLTDGRSGLLMRPSVLMSNLERERPIHRGGNVRTRFLCDVIPPPPANVDNIVAQNLAAINPLLMSERDVTTSVTSASSCMSCHSQMNPLGYTLGAFGALGERRALENIFDSNGVMTASFPINSNASNLNIQTSADSANNEHDLLNLVSGSSKAQACMTQMIFRFSRLRNETSADQCVLSDEEGLVRANSTIQSVLLSNVTSDDIFWKGP